MAVAKKPRSRRKAPGFESPSQRIERGVAWLSAPEAARRLGVTGSMLYRVIRQGDLTTRTWLVGKHEDYEVLYVTLLSLEQYRLRRDAWKRMHGRKK